ncbi:tetratricopeptide repeat protein [Ornithinimicrobium cerasi]|uniref:tetratricopeptide repeat protein n=1 Tax=Ornithinimicrobium cerasi TaxID=2248773 RepID=UPI000EFEF8C3|nr:tetratricopeptide repeat protein [Ornithinimicrobium cerasi]
MDADTKAHVLALLGSDPRMAIAISQPLAQHDSRAAVLLGRAHLRLKDYLAAEAAFARARELDANYVEAVWYSGVVAERQGRLAEAQGLYRRVLEMNPQFTKAQQKLSLADPRDSATASSSAKGPPRTKLWLPEIEEMTPEYGKRLRTARRAERSADILGVTWWMAAVLGVSIVAVLAFMVWVFYTGSTSANKAELRQCEFIAEHFPEDLTQGCLDLLGEQ